MNRSSKTSSSFKSVLTRVAPASDFGKIFLLFLVSHFFILFNRSIGWDGYALLHGTYDSITSDFRIYGMNELLGIIHFNLVHLSSNPVLVYNCAVLLTSFIAVLLTFLILNRVGLFSRNDVFAVSLLTGVLPYTFISLIGITAIIFYDLFLVGLYLLVLYLDNRNILLRVGALVAFFVSFFYNSHVSYYLVALLVIGYKTSPPFRLRTYFTRFLDFTLLPVLYVIYHQVSFSMQEGHKVTNYNSFDIFSFLQLPLYLGYSIQQSFFRLFEMIFDLMAQMHSVIIIFIIFPLVYLVLRNRSLQFTESKIRLFSKFQVKKSHFFLVLGTFLFLLGAFPFSLVSKPPGFYSSGAADMHQCNLYIGAALIIYSLLVIFLKESFQKPALIFLLSCFILLGFKNVLSFNKQWLKEESILVNAAENESIRNNQTFLVDDYAEELNSSFTLQVYTLNGILSRAFNGEQRRFAITREELGTLFSRTGKMDSVLLNSKARPGFQMKDYQVENFDRNIVITNGSLKLTDPVTLRLLYYSYFDRDKFNQMVKKVVSLKDHLCDQCKTLVN